MTENTQGNWHQNYCRDLRDRIGERCKLGAVIVDSAVVDLYVSNQGRWNDRP